MPRMETMTIYGYHPVERALAQRPDVVQTVYATERVLGDPERNAKIVRSGADVALLDPKKLPKGVAHDAVHQGIVATVNLSKLVVPFDTFLKACEPTPATALVVLGEIQDPHNAGAIIRSAAAFGATAVLIPKHRQAPINGTVVKTSAGNVFTVPIVAVSNVNRALATLKEHGFWTYGLAGEGSTPLTDEAFEKPSVFVIGNEGSGLREKTRAVCDSLLSIPMHPRAESVNASVAAAVTLYAWQSTKQ